MPVFYWGNGLRAGHSNPRFARAYFESTPIQGCFPRHTGCLHYCKHTSENIEIKKHPKKQIRTHRHIHFPFEYKQFEQQCSGFFFGSIMWCCSSDNHPSGDLVKFWQYSKYESRKSFSHGKQLWWFLVIFLVRKQGIYDRIFYQTAKVLHKKKFSMQHQEHNPQLGHH
jgi:hypothetical protein